jgi:hypothetical protein
MPSALAFKINEMIFPGTPSWRSTLPKLEDGARRQRSLREPGMDYTKLTIAELANGISKTEAAIRRCREILDDLQEPKTAGMQAVVKAIRHLLPQARRRSEGPRENLRQRDQARALDALI